MKKISFFARQAGDGLVFSNGTEAAWAECLDSMKIDQQVKITVEAVTVRNMEVLQQRRYYRGVVVKILAGSMGYEPEEMHQLLAEKFLGYTKKGKSGKEHTFIKSTADGEIDTKEFTLFLDKCLALGEELKLRMPTPEEIEKNPFILKELYPKIYGRSLDTPGTLADLQKIFHIFPSQNG